MSISNILQDNSFKIYCGSLDTENIILNGSTLANPDNIVEIAPLSVLSNDKLVSGNSSNQIKTTNIDSSNDSLNIPNGKSYSINNNPMLFQNMGQYTVKAGMIFKNNINQIRTPYTVVSQVIDDGDFIGNNDLCIQNAINSLSVTGGSVFIKNGIYDIQNTINLLSNVNLIGETTQGCILYGNTLNPINNILKSSTQTIGQVINNISFSGKSLISHVDLDIIKSKISNCLFDGTGVSPLGLYLASSGIDLQPYNNIELCVFNNFTVYSIHTSININNSKVINCNFLNNIDSLTLIHVYNQSLGISYTNLIFEPCDICIYTETPIFCTSCLFVFCNICIKINIINTPIFPTGNFCFISGMKILNFGSLTDVIHSTVMNGEISNIYASDICFTGIYGACKGFSFYGLGTHQYNISNCNQIYGSITDGLGIINPSSFIKEGENISSVEPTCIYGTIYLDDGTNASGMTPKYRRFNGTIWQDL